MKRQSAIALFLFAVTQIGCNTLASKPVDKLASDSLAPRTDTTVAVASAPQRVAIIWNEKILRPVDQPAVRGFTGRIYFYNQNDQPVTADGELTVYGYDDTQSSSHEVADRKYVFPAEKFSTHYSPSELGHSYTIWVPWENYGGYRKAISLVPVFKLADNRVIQGTSNRVALTGQPPQDAPWSQPQSLDQFSQQSLSASDYHDGQTTIQNRPQSPPARRQADSFPVPQSMATRIQSLPANWNSSAARQLSNMDNPQFNPQGDLYNQVHFRESTNSNPNQTSNQNQYPLQQQPQGTYSTFNDQQMLQGSQTHPADQNRPVYGKPGSFR